MIRDSLKFGNVSIVSKPAQILRRIGQKTQNPGSLCFCFHVSLKNPLRASAEDSANGCRADSNQLPNYSMNLRNPNHFNEHLNVKPKPNRNRQLPQSELAPPLSGSSPSKPCKESRKNPKNTIEKKESRATSKKLLFDWG